MLTSNGSRTSPVERGVFILRKLLDNPPPPAPADVPEAEDVPGKNQTTRELLNHHQTTAQCASCHSKIDPLGFGMEGFGPLGRVRTHEGKRKIDASGKMANGTNFNDFQGLIDGLAAHDKRIAQSFLKAVMAYGIGRDVRFTDRAEIEKILQTHKTSGYQLRDLMYSIATSQTFRSKM